MRLSDPGRFEPLGLMSQRGSVSTKKRATFGHEHTHMDVKGKQDDTSHREQEEAFVSTMRQHAMDFYAHDVDRNLRLDYEQFAHLVREREVGIFSEQVMRYRFKECQLLSTNQVEDTGYVTIGQYFFQALRDAVKRSAIQAKQLFELWDSDGDGEVSKLEFRRAFRAFGFKARDEDLDAIFRELDSTKGSGTISFQDVSRELFRSAPLPESRAERDILLAARVKRDVRRACAAEHQYVMDMAQPVAEFTRAEDVSAHLQHVLERNIFRLVDLFRAWDWDQSGTVEKTEFRRAMRALGCAAPKADIEQLFDQWDLDGNGSIDYHELAGMLYCRLSNLLLQDAGLLIPSLRRCLPACRSCAERLNHKAQVDAKLHSSKVSGNAHNRDTPLRSPRTGSTGVKHRSKSLFGPVFAVGEGSLDLEEQIASAITRSGAKVTQLFHSWDTDGECVRRRLNPSYPHHVAHMCPPQHLVPATFHAQWRNFKFRVDACYGVLWTHSWLRSYAGSHETVQACRC